MGRHTLRGKKAKEQAQAAVNEEDFPLPDENVPLSVQRRGKPLSPAEEPKYKMSLERKCQMDRYVLKKSKTSTNVRVDFNTFEILWDGGKADLMYVNEVRIDEHALRTKGFALSADSEKPDPSRSFVVLHGTEFRLKQLCLVAPTKDIRDTWAKGIWHFSRACSPHLYSRKLLLERFMEKSWRDCVSDGQFMTIKDARTWTNKYNIKVQKEDLRAKVRKLGQANGHADKFGREHLERFYEDVIQSQELKQLVFELVGYKDPLTPEDLIAFYSKYQGEHLSEQDAITIIQNHGSPQASSLSLSAFINFLFSSDNDCIKPSKVENLEDMGKPLAHYFIDSSHNTYLMGDQLRSESSVEAYVRCLRQGCRCLEIDTWDGNNDPIVYHGHTLTSKIKFYDVIVAINDHAFYASDYPLILSIEQHCNLENQRKMAEIFKEVFGDQLLTEGLPGHTRSDKEYPSPRDLRRKIIIKHKKLPLGATSGEVESNRNDEEDVSASAANGDVFIKNSIGVWRKHYFVVDKTKFCYSQNTGDDQDQDEEEEDDQDGEIDPDLDVEDRVELHFNEPWFHGRVGGNGVSGRAVCEQRIREHGGPPGSFIVRHSDSYKGEYSLSFSQGTVVQHCRIRKGLTDDGEAQYYMTSSQSFPNLYELVEYHKVEPLVSDAFEVRLTEPVPPPPPHEVEPWFHKGISRADAEEKLKRVREDSTFLVRSGPPTSPDEEEHFAVSFRAEGKIRHCQITKDGRLFTIGDAEFESLNSLVKYYKKHPLYRKTKLMYAVNEQFLEEFGQDPEEDIYMSEDLYQQPNSSKGATVAPTTGIACRAVYPYRATQDDELSFPKGAIIVNVQKQEGGRWYSGDYLQGRGKLFPSNYVEEIDHNQMVSQARDDAENPLGELEEESIPLKGLRARRTDPQDGHDLIVEVITNERRLELSFGEDEAVMNNFLTAVNGDSTASAKRSVKTSGKVKIDTQMSDLVYYCQGVKFPGFDVKAPFYHMSSFQERKALSYYKINNPKDAETFCDYNVRQITRVYPNGKRIDSSNYSPQDMWNCGCQMVALNYQTPDKPMWLNHGKFAINRRCGYVLKPEALRAPGFHPFAEKHSKKAGGIKLIVTVIGGRHLVKPTKGVASPTIEVDVVGLDGTKIKTPTVMQNGLCPFFNMSNEFEISYPDIACLRFIVHDMDMFGDANAIGQAVYPLGPNTDLAIRQGYRSVQLKNGFNESLGLSSLLIHIAVEEKTKAPSKVDDVRKQLRKLYAERDELVREVLVQDKKDEAPSKHKIESLNKLNTKLEGLEQKLMDLEGKKQKKKKPKK